MIREFQPSYFTPCTNLVCYEQEDKCQKANYSDDYYAQFDSATSLTSTTNIVENGGFDTDLSHWTQTNSGAADWAWNAGKAEVQSVDSEFIFQDLGLTLCELAFFQFDYTVPAGVTLEFGTYLSTSNYTAIDTVTGNGHWMGYSPAAYSYIYFKVTGADAEHVVTIDNVSVFEVKAAGKLKDCCDNTIRTLDPCDFTYYYTPGCSEPDYFDLAFKWSDYISTPGKFKICLEDVQLLKNYNFFDLGQNWSQTAAYDVDWLYGADGVYGNHTAYIADLDAGKKSEILYQEVSLPVCDYNLKVTFLNAGGVTCKSHLWINDELFLTNNEAGTTQYSVLLKTAGWNYPIEKIGFQIESTSNNTSIVIDSISIESDICSPCYCLESSHSCTLLLEARNNEDAFGLNFNTSTKFSLRIESELLNFKSEISEAIVESSNGVNQLYFSQFKDMKDLKIYAEPENVWKAIEMMMLCTDFRINKQSYTKKEGAIEKTYLKAGQIYYGAVQVMRKTQDYKNYY